MGAEQRVTSSSIATLHEAKVIANYLGRYLWAGLRGLESYFERVVVSRCFAACGILPHLVVVAKLFKSLSAEITRS